MNSIYILDCSAFRQQSPGQTYRFQSVRKTMVWPMKHGRHLGPGGAWNLFWRLGFRPQIVHSIPDGEGLLVVSAEGSLPQDTLAGIRAWLKRGGHLLCAGDVTVFSEILEHPIQGRTMSLVHPRAGLAWVDAAGNAEIMAPANWEYTVFSDLAGCETSGMLASVGGELQTPARALVQPISGAPAILRLGKAVYLNGNPFRAYQAWLQGQEKLSFWLNWRPRLFWLDEHAAFLWRWFKRHSAVPAGERPGISGLGETTVVLRHDLDSSRDTSYLDLEQEQGIAASHAVLLDDNARFWVQTLREHPGHECCFHYDSTRPQGLFRRLRERWTSRRINYEPGLRRLSPAGMLQQVRQAMDRGINCRTIHRHGPFMLYPEHIETLARLAQNIPDFLGGNNFFCGQFLLWGSYWPVEETTLQQEWPCAMFPTWLPFRPVHAGDAGRLLDVWEGGNVMECEAELVEQMLDHAIPELPQRVLTFNYHPFHAHSAAFAPQGNLDTFRRVLGLFQQRNCSILPLREVYALADAALGEVAR